MLGALEWARVRALAADGVSQREIARRLGINRRTVARPAAREEPPRYRRPARGSQLDRFEPVLRRLVEEWPQIKAPQASEVLREYGYVGSVDIVRRRLRQQRPPVVRPAQRTAIGRGRCCRRTRAERPLQGLHPARSEARNRRSGRRSRRPRRATSSFRGTRRRSATSPRPVTIPSTLRASPRQVDRGAGHGQPSLLSPTGTTASERTTIRRAKAVPASVGIVT